uniref:Uncharacterized protein AlNc14C330G10679 n=1 Tax=Albugo laibachii Nc14 TaxID=890382 RepID=F0WWR5_9STRA|nr:putative GPIanchored serinethreonine rich hypothetical protein [Albugo laibachii Nc14]|eukprot:CCA25892.1 putative GPIanchored serinethreonine rich hypothetical protein [Albugo laibachii Nc14]
MSFSSCILLCIFPSALQMAPLSLSDANSALRLIGSTSNIRESLLSEQQSIQMYESDNAQSSSSHSNADKVYSLLPKSAESIDAQSPMRSDPLLSTGASSSDDPLDRNRVRETKDPYHMKRVRVIHARVQSDTPTLLDGRFVSSFGASNNDLKSAYLAAMDTVNTESVEGALVYVQAECINVNGRSPENRCRRKNNAKHLVFYEIDVVQPNASIAQFQENWETFEYGPMIPMDEGRCTPLEEDKLPPGCLQFNGENQQPNTGPFVGGGHKSTDPRAPYRYCHWFSFPNSCPTKSWNEKTVACRQSTKKGLCDLGVAPNGVDCTFAYNILGWVPLDDVVGITSIRNPVTGNAFGNFSEWCEASDQNIEFAADIQTGRFEKGLVFWQNPTDLTANEKRAEKVIQTYANVLINGSSQIPSQVVKHFRRLPSPMELAAMNPPCYYNVPQCGKKPGCKRVGYAQICQLCAPSENCDIGTFRFPILEKPHTILSDAETKTPTAISEALDNSSDDGFSGTDRVRLSLTAAFMIVSFQAIFIL